MMGDVHRGMCVLGPPWPASALLTVQTYVSCVAAVSCDTFAIRPLGIIILLHFVRSDALTKGQALPIYMEAEFFRTTLQTNL